MSCESLRLFNGIVNPHMYVFKSKLARLPIQVALWIVKCFNNIFHGSHA